MKKIITLGLLVLTSACADNKLLFADNNLAVDYGTKDTVQVQQADPQIGYQALKQAPLCCHSLNEIDYQKIDEPAEFVFKITAKNQVFRFTTGKSFVQGIQLPNATEGIEVSVSAPIYNSAFVPTVLVLDENYQPIQVYGQETIKYDPSSILNVDRFFGRIKLPTKFADGRIAKYLIILTTDEAMQQTTLLEKPDQSAEQTGRVDVMRRIYLDKPISHTADGIFKMAFDYTPSTKDTAYDMMAKGELVSIVPDNKDSDKVAPSDLVVLEKQKVKIDKHDNLSTEQVQSDLDSKYARLIEQAVKAGDNQKALHYVKEAEAVGSTKARDVFVDAMIKNQ